MKSRLIQMEQKSSHLPNISGVFTCLHNTIATVSRPYQRLLITSKKLSLILAQSQNSTSWRLILNTRGTITSTPWRLSTKPERLIWLTGIWTISVSSISWGARSQNWERLFWGSSWEMKPAFMSFKITGTSSKLPNHSSSKETSKLDFVIWISFPSISLISKATNTTSTHIAWENGP